jgi:hypothetical protein
LSPTLDRRRLDLARSLHPLRRRAVRYAAIAIALLVAFSTNASARTWNVYVDGSGDSPTIQAAMGPPIGGFTLARNSPCLPKNNACGVLIGAFGEGCAPTSIEELSWGRIKGMYRDGGR